jgi:hypothetical protein
MSFNVSKLGDWFTQPPSGVIDMCCPFPVSCAYSWISGVPAQIARSRHITASINKAFFRETRYTPVLGRFVRFHANSTKSFSINVKHTSHRVFAATSFLRYGDRYLRAGWKADSDPALKARLDPVNAR